MAGEPSRMTRIKFPKTRRDRQLELDDVDLDSQLDHAREIYKPTKRKKKRNEDGSTTDSVPSSVGTSDSNLPYGTGKLLQRRVFGPESTLPVATNEDSWSPASTFNRDRHYTIQSAKSGIVVPPGGVRGLPTTEELDEDVFANDDDPVDFGYAKTAHYLDRHVPAAASSYYAPSYGQNTSMYAPSAYGEDLKANPYEGAASAREIFFCIWGIGTYLVDIGSDIALAHEYYTLGNPWWCALTLLFFLVPSVSMSIFSFILYVRDWRIVGEKASILRWASRGIFLILQLAPLLRVIDTLVYGCRSRSTTDMGQRRSWYVKMLDEDTDFALLRLFEAFMEAAPQLVLQLYIMTQVGTSKGTFLVALQVLGMITSLVTLATVLVSFQKSLRLSLPEKAKLTFWGMVLQFLWRICTITPRVLALALFASYFHYYVFVVVAVHWMIMMIWVIKQETRYCMLKSPSGGRHHSRGLEFCFRFLAAFVHIFCFFNLIEGHTRLRCVFFYTLTYIENLVLVVTWYIVATTNNELSWYYLPGIVCVLFVFWVGIGFQVLYYLCCHPNNLSVLHVRKRIRCCIKCSELTLTEDAETVHEHHANSPQSVAGTAIPSVYDGENERMLRASEVPSSLHGAPVLRTSEVPAPLHGAPVQRYPSNASSNSSSLPNPPVRSYNPLISSKKQAFKPQMHSSPHGSLIMSPLAAPSEHVQTTV